MAPRSDRDGADRDPTLSEYSGFVQDSGEGRWTIQAAVDEAVPWMFYPPHCSCVSIATGAYLRGEMLSAMRQKFGGHVEARCEAVVTELRIFMNRSRN